MSSTPTGSGPTGSSTELLAGVAVRAHGQRVALARLVHGKATVSLPRYRSTGVKAVVVRYLGWSLAESTRTTSRFRVVR